MFWIRARMRVHSAQRLAHWCIYDTHNDIMYITRGCWQRSKSAALCKNIHNTTQRNTQIHSHTHIHTAQCLALSGSDASGGMFYVNGQIEISGGSRPAKGTFTVNSLGSITSITLTDRGDGYTRTPTASNVSIFYHGTRIEQSYTVTDISLDATGSNYIPGAVIITGGTRNAIGSFSVSPGTGAIMPESVILSDNGSGFFLRPTAGNVRFVYSGTFTPQASTVTSVTISGTMATAYTSDATATVTCTAPCTGTGFAATCAVRSGEGPGRYVNAWMHECSYEDVCVFCEVFCVWGCRWFFCVGHLVQTYRYYI